MAVAPEGRSAGLDTIGKYAVPANISEILPDAPNPTHFA
jgi:hypothetical protein